MITNVWPETYPSEKPQELRKTRKSNAVTWAIQGDSQTTGRWNKLLGKTRTEDSRAIDTPRYSAPPL